MILSDEIKIIIHDYIECKYEEYLHNNKILLLKENIITNNVKDFYINNKKEIKSKIRSSLKDKYKEEYNSLTTENIIYEIFQDDEFNIKKIVKELQFIQDKNIKKINIPIINNSLNLNISIISNFILINSSNIKNIDNYKDIYNIVENYKFIYSIDNLILEEIDNNEKIDKIKEKIKNKTEVSVELYYSKKNTENNENQ